jgi:tRNA(Ile)-lysidine synthase
LEQLSVLRDKRNLLAFSAGVDSSAIFFLLMDANIKFDIAIVDYGKRESSYHESIYAKELCQKYNKTCFTKSVTLNDSNFEKHARTTRYNFFEEIIQDHSYDNLITAHQLNDRLEWFLMQFTKGAGVVELLGYKAFEKRDNYNLVRPLINTSKKELLNYLHKNSIKYFEDESNLDPKYKRNLFRHEFSNRLLDEYENGISKSFNYLNEDSKKLFALEIIHHVNDLFVIKDSGDDGENIRAVDKIIKRLGVIISSKDREEIIRQKDIIVAHKIAVSFKDNKIYISPFKESVMDKEFKERCRVLKIPPKIRGYLWDKKINISLLS